MKKDSAETDLVRRVCIAVLMMLAFVSTFTRPHLIFGITVVFTNIFLIGLIRLQGIRMGILVSASAYGIMIALNAAPAYVLIFFLELLWIAICIYRNQGQVLKLDLYFWLLIGLPLTAAVFFTSGSYTMIEFALLFAITVSNSLFNILTADMLDYYVMRRVIPPAKEYRPPIPFKRVLFHLTVTTVSLPFLINLTVGGWHSIDSSKMNALKTAESTAERILSELEHRGEEGLQTGDLQEIASRFATPAPGLLNIVIAGKEGVALAASDMSLYANWKPREPLKPVESRFEIDLSEESTLLPTGRWHDANYVYTASSDKQEYLISVILPVMPYQTAIFLEYIYQILYMMASASIAVCLALCINAWLERSLKRLELNSSRLPVKLRQMAVPDWSSSGILEIDSLAHNFKSISDELLNRFEEMESINSQLRVSEEKLKYLAYYDTLTGLPNRLRFRQRLSEMIRDTGFREKIAVLFVDINRFKEVNDALGHISGDLLLLKVSLRFEQLADEQCEVFRLGGDEFIFLYKYISDDDLPEMAKRIGRLFDSPLELEGNYIYITLSIGVSIYPEHGISQDDIVRKADMAMYAAREKGEGSYYIFNRDRENAMNETVLLENGLRTALHEEQLYLVYQPKVNPVTGRMRGYEALIRWNHPELGAIPPSKFIPIAEASGVIADIDFWMLREACRQTKEWHELKVHKLPISVNLSTKHFYRMNIVGRIHSILRQTGLEPHYLGLELTESVFMNQTEQVVEALQELKRMGIEIVIEEFGTGYTSLSRLRHLPVSTVKLDRTFFHNGEDLTEDNASVVKGIAGLVNSMGLKVTAEGIETETEQELFVELNCEELQGNFFSPPLDSRSFERYAAAEQGLHTEEMI